MCGVSKEQWNTGDGDDDDGLPDRFYVAPKDVYMPDLTAVADVLLGKLVSTFFLPYHDGTSLIALNVGIRDGIRMHRQLHSVCIRWVKYLSMHN